MKSPRSLWFLLVAPLAMSAQETSQVTALRAEFRHGQTFLTWHEPSPTANYRVYRSTQPFTGANQLTEDTLVATVREHSSLNLMASINRLDLSKVPRTEAYAISRRNYFVVADGAVPLGDDTGLLVLTAYRDEPAYYAVTAVHDGALLEECLAEPLHGGRAEPGALPDRASR